MVDRRGGGEAQREEEEVLHGDRGLASVDLLGNGRTCKRHRWKGRSAGVVRRRRGQYMRELVGPPEVSLHSLYRPRRKASSGSQTGPPWGTRACWLGRGELRHARSASMHGVVRADRKENPLAWPTPPSPGQQNGLGAPDEASGAARAKARRAGDGHGGSAFRASSLGPTSTPPRATAHTQTNPTLLRVRCFARLRWSLLSSWEMGLHCICPGASSLSVYEAPLSVYGAAHAAPTRAREDRKLWSLRRERRPKLLRQEAHP